MSIPANSDDPLETTRSLVDWLAGNTSADDAAEPALAFAHVADWIDGWLAPALELKAAHGSSGGANWCPQWFDHPQVVLRLTAAWREWETARVTEGMSRWWWQDWDAHLAAITAEHGPFSRCRNEHQRTLAPVDELPSHMRKDLNTTLRGLG